VHRPLTATVLLFTPLDSTGDDGLHVFLAIDHCLFRPPEMEELLAEVSRRFELPADRITFAFSHTHSGGHVARSRAELPGGTLIEPYLAELPDQLAGAFAAAKTSLQPATLTYGSAFCEMGQNRDYWDAESEQHVCGFNPDRPTQLPVNVVRITGAEGALLGSVVNYPCHPTTLAWDNQLISPDYVGALRETVEETTGCISLFLLAPCGDIGPMHGFVGDVEVADRNGRQLAYAALGALEALPPADTDLYYAGPVLSGATIGTWERRPQSPERIAQTARFRHRQWEVLLDYRAGTPTVEDAEAQLKRRLEEEANARQQGDLGRAGESRALAERTRRLLERIRPLPQQGQYPFTLDVKQIGDACWVSIEGEPYHALQQELIRRFPQRAIIPTVLANGSRSSYLPTRDDYEKDLYQVGVALLAPGCLETVTDEIAAQINRWLDDDAE
jgi:hypothetical protein